MTFERKREMALVNLYFFYYSRSDSISLHITQDIYRTLDWPSKYRKFMKKCRKRVKDAHCAVRDFIKARFYRAIFIPAVCHRLKKLFVLKMTDSSSLNLLFKGLANSDVSLELLSLHDCSSQKALELDTSNLKTLSFQNGTCSEVVWITLVDFLRRSNELTSFASFYMGMHSRALAKHGIASFLRAPFWREFKYSTFNLCNQIIERLEEGGFIETLSHDIFGIRVAKPLIR